MISSLAVAVLDSFRGIAYLLACLPACFSLTWFEVVINCQPTSSRRSRLAQVACYAYRLHHYQTSSVLQPPASYSFIPLVPCTAGGGRREKKGKKKRKTSSISSLLLSVLAFQGGSPMHYILLPSKAKQPRQDTAGCCAPRCRASATTSG